MSGQRSFFLPTLFFLTTIYLKQVRFCERMGEEKDFGTLHWAFSAAKKTMAEHGDQALYTCASGITPSGVIHIGNFRESITVDLVKRAFLQLGKKARHMHSWDTNDVFRKVPKNMPQQDMLKHHLRRCIVDVPDPFGEEESYAAKHMKDVEKELPKVGVRPEYRYQHQKYRACEYADQIKHALEHTEDIKKILNQYREEPLDKEWLPVSIFCDTCAKDTITRITYPGGYKLTYSCVCGHEETFDFRHKGIVKLLWRVDWPMRWDYERVHFEPGGKDHSSPGGSYDTGKKIVQKVWNRKAPTYIMYDFIRIKGAGGKISSSLGNVVTLKDCLGIYEPEIVRYLFASTRPGAEFAISFDADVIKIYEDYDKCERVYYGKEAVKEKEHHKQHIIYQFSQIPEDSRELPEIMPLQISFRHLLTIIQVKDMNEQAALDYFRDQIRNERDEHKLRTRIRCARHWLEHYADDQFRFVVKETKDESMRGSLSQEQRQVLDSFKQVVQRHDDAESLEQAIYQAAKASGMPTKDFFKLCYQALIGKDRGPKLAPFIIEIGRERVLKLL